MSFRPRYKPDRRATGRFMKGSSMQALMRRRAEKGARYAETISPRESGEYASKFRVESTVGEDRAEARIVNDATHAVPVELKHRVMGRTVDYLEGGDG